MVVAIVVVTAPANWLARYVASRTDGRVALADAQGTVWSGNAVIAVGPAAIGDAVPQRVALPGRINWQLRFPDWLAPDLLLTHDGVLERPVVVRYRRGDLDVDDGTAQLPASMLQIVGAPLNTLRPEGRIVLQWTGAHLDTEGTWIGNGAVRVQDFALAVSPVRPLGDYTLTWSAGREGLAWTLTTARGPLDVRGSGKLAGRVARTHVVARVAAGTPPAVVAQLNALFDTIGRPGAGEVVFDSGGAT